MDGRTHLVPRPLKILRLETPNDVRGVLVNRREIHVFWDLDAAVVLPTKTTQETRQNNKIPTRQKTVHQHTRETNVPEYFV